MNILVKTNIPFGVMWANTVNLGDDIQTLAAINFLKKKHLKAEVFVNREELINYNGPEINLIMNGWFMHDINKFPPSEKINPIFISFHCANENLIRNNIDYFKKYEPIGCRDTKTVELFHKYNIKAYFTGCLTLYFDKHTSKGSHNYIVDVNTCKYIPKVNFDRSNYNDFIEITHDLSLSEDWNDQTYRLEKAQNILNLYSEAALVVTSRLHVALPCRALGTEIKFIHSNLNDSRFSGLSSILVEGADMKDIINGFDQINLI